MSLAALAMTVMALGAPAPPDVGDLARAEGLDRIAAHVERRALPAIRIRRGRPRAVAALGTSRLGGLPDLARGARWPRCGRRPAVFLGQIDLATLPPSELPRRGLLSFFVDVEIERSVPVHAVGAGPCGAIRHTAAGVSLRRLAYPGRGPRLAIRSAPVAATAPEMTVEPPISAPLRDDREYEAYERLEDRLDPRTGRAPRHRLLGHPLQVQADPRWACPGGRRHPERWRVVLQLGWDEPIGFAVADGGMVWLLVRGADLRRARFDRVCAAFDSG